MEYFLLAKEGFDLLLLIFSRALQFGNELYFFCLQVLEMVSFCDEFAGCCLHCLSIDNFVFVLYFLADGSNQLVQMFLLCLFNTFFGSLHSLLVLLLPFLPIFIQFSPGLSFQLNAESIQLIPIKFVYVMIFYCTLMRVSSHRFFLTLLVHNVQSPTSLVITDLLLYESWTSRYFLNGVFPKDWHPFLMFECISDFDLHLNRMVKVSCSFLQVDVVNFSLPVNIRLPVWIEFLSK